MRFGVSSDTGSKIADVQRKKVSASSWVRDQRLNVATNRTSGQTLAFQSGRVGVWLLLVGFIICAS